MYLPSTSCTAHVCSQVLYTALSAERHPMDMDYLYTIMEMIGGTGANVSHVEMIVNLGKEAHE